MLGFHTRSVHLSNAHRPSVASLAPKLPDLDLCILSLNRSCFFSLKTLRRNVLQLDVTLDPFCLQTHVAKFTMKETHTHKTENGWGTTSKPRCGPPSWMQKHILPSPVAAKAILDSTCKFCSKLRSTSCNIEPAFRISFYWAEFRPVTVTGVTERVDETASNFLAKTWKHQASKRQSSMGLSMLAVWLWT